MCRSYSEVAQEVCVDHTVCGVAQEACLNHTVYGVAQEVCLDHTVCGVAQEACVHHTVGHWGWLHSLGHSKLDCGSPHTSYCGPLQVFITMNIINGY